MTWGGERGMGPLGKGVRTGVSPSWGQGKVGGRMEARGAA